MKVEAIEETTPRIWEMRNERFVAGTAIDLFGHDFASMAGWGEFQGYWDNLERDRYMNDGGTYRYRRFGRFKWFSDAKRLELQPHGPYRQPTYFNPLNGGMERLFAPVTEDMAENEVVRTLLGTLANVYSEIEDVPVWKINAYFNRIVATSEEHGLPVPEGMHRDGVKFSCLFMADRKGVSGGVTTLVDLMNKYPLYTGSLEKPCDALIFRDDSVFHDTTAIVPTVGGSKGHRDVLVIEIY
jgi:hypothetical protein